MLELDSFQRHLAAHNRSGRTKKTYAAIVAAFFASRIGASSVGAPSRPEVEKFIGRPLRDGEPRSVATRNQELAALRAYAAFAKRELGWVEDPTDGIVFLKEPPRDPPVLSVFEIRKLFALAGNAATGWRRDRDLAILALLSQLGLRVHELVGLNVEQIDLATATLLDVLGKGGSRHDLPVNAPTLALLQAWLDARNARSIAHERALFVTARGTRISIRSVERFIERLRALSGTKKRVTPHTLRHSTATVCLTLGIDVSTVSELLRHADLNTTRKYLHLVDERKREAVRRLAVAISPEIMPVAISAPGMDMSASAGSAVEMDHRGGAVQAEHGTASEPAAVPLSILRKNKENSTPLPLDDQGDMDDVRRAA